MEDYTYSMSDLNLLTATVFQLKSTLEEFNPTRIPYIWQTTKSALSILLYNQVSLIIPSEPKVAVKCFSFTNCMRWHFKQGGSDLTLCIQEWYKLEMALMAACWPIIASLWTDNKLKCLNSNLDKPHNKRRQDDGGGQKLLGVGFQLISLYWCPIKTHTQGEFNLTRISYSWKTNRRVSPILVYGDRSLMTIKLKFPCIYLVSQTTWDDTSNKVIQT